MKKYIVKTPYFVKLLFTNWVWSIAPKKEKCLYLTFDDGPTAEITEWVLNELDTYNAKATFFCIGKNIAKHPSIFTKIIRKKHTVGNHTHNHLKSTKTSPKIFIENVSLAEAELKHLQHQGTKLFRPLTEC